MMVAGENNGAALADADIAPQQWQGKLPDGGTIEEIDIVADGGTPQVIIAINHGGALTDLVSAPLATGGAGAEACARVASEPCVFVVGAPTSNATLQNVTTAVGDFIETRSATAGGVAAIVSMSVIVSVAGGGGGGGGGSGTVTSVATAGPLTGGPITTTGTIDCPTCVTSAAALTANELVIGAGSQTSATLGSLGTVTTLLHGNAGGAPSFGAVAFADIDPAALNGGGTLLPTTDGSFVNGHCSLIDANATLIDSGFAGCAGTGLNNLASVAINTTLLPASAASAALGSNALPFSNVFIGGSANKSASLDVSALSTNRILSVEDVAGIIGVITGAVADTDCLQASVVGPITKIVSSGAACTPVAGANTALSNLAATSVSQSLVPGTAAAVNLGTAPKPWGALYVGNAANQAAFFDPAALSTNRNWAMQDSAGVLTVLAGGLVNGNCAAISVVGPVTTLVDNGGPCGAGGTGTVTNAAASFTGGLISIAGSPITTTGTFAFTVAGTSGGIPYFNSGTTWASSAALGAGLLVKGGGAGVAPATFTLGGDCTFSTPNITCTKTGGVAFTGAATMSLPVAIANGGTGTGSTLVGLVRGSASAFTAAELSGDATTSASNVVTVVKVHGVAYPVTGALFDALPVLTSSNVVGYFQINAGNDCGDGTHALKYSQTTHLIGCQTLSTGAGTVTGSGTVNKLPKWSGSITNLADSCVDDGLTTANTFTVSCSAGLAVNTGGPSNLGLTDPGARQTFSIQMVNGSGGTINSGTPVKMSGTADQITPTITTDTAAYVALGVVETTCNNGANCTIVLFGMVRDMVLGTGTCSIGQSIIVDTTTNARVKCTSSPTAGTVIAIATTAQITVGSAVIGVISGTH